jgi:hypothetical protein
MIWFKSALVGLAAAFIAVVVAVAGLFATASWHIDTGEGSGGIGIVVVNVLAPLVLVPAILAFALSFRWSLRRGRKKRSLRGA